MIYQYLFSAVCKYLGIEISAIKDYIEFLSSDQSVNQELLLTLLDLTAAHVILEDWSKSLN